MLLASRTSRKYPLTFRRVLPPRLGWFASHEADGGDEYVKLAGIVSYSGGAAQVLVHLVRIFAQEVLWGGDADQLPNGNVLLTEVELGRIIEVTPEGDIVWDMQILNGLLPHDIYQFQRIPY